MTTLARLQEFSITINWLQITQQSGFILARHDYHPATTEILVPLNAYVLTTII
jgi:hypothetical protein